MVEAQLRKMRKDNLIELIKMLYRNWLTIDGFWFGNVEDQCGQEVAHNIDMINLTRYAAIEAKRLRRVLNISERGIPALIKTLPFIAWAPTTDWEFSSVTSRRAIFTVRDCSVQRWRIENGREEFNCKAINEAYFESFLRVIDPAIRTRCLVCPPDPHPEDLWCEWEFSIDSGSG